MAFELKTEISIAASKELVWQILTDFDKYPDWNPFIKSLTGDVAVGNKIKVVLSPPEGKPMVFKPVVKSLKINSEFKWLGHLMFPGLFDGEHKFEIVEQDSGNVKFIQSERFKGLLVPLFKKMLETNTKQGFEQMNSTLKEIAERKS